MDKSDLQIVTSSKLYLDSQFEKIDEDGLLSQRIFGPKLSYKCACGYYSSKIQFAGKRCPKCGVLCTDNFIRYKTFAKIVLPFPIFKPTYKNRKLINTVLGKHKYLLDIKQLDLALTNNIYLSYNAKTDKLKIVNDYNKETCIPLTIKGIYSLFLGICSIQTYFNSAAATNIINNCFSYELLVIPPEIRPVYKKCDVGQVSLVQSEINKYYINLLNLASYDWREIMTNPCEEKDTYIRTTLNSMFEDPIEDPQLLFYDNAVVKYQRYVNQIYSSVINSLSTKNGIIRKDLLGKSIDFCSRTHVIVDPSLKAYEIKLPRNNLIRLYFIEYIKFLLDKKHIKMDDILSCVKLTESKITNKYPEYIDEFIEYLFNELDYHNRIVLINRQPTLWRYGIPSVTIAGVTEGDVTATSPLFLEAPNMDFDGDTASVIRIHDKQAQFELEELAHVSNNIRYDHNPTFINKCKGEAMYAAHFMLSAEPDLKKQKRINISSLSELPIDDFNELFNVTTPVYINDQLYSYGQCLFNYWCGFKTLKIFNFVEPNYISKEIFRDSNSNIEYHKRLQQIMSQLFWFSSLNYKSPLTFDFSDVANLQFEEEKRILKQLPQNPYIGQHIYKAIINQIYQKIPDCHFFGKLLSSKLGKIKTQLSRISGAIGYIADDNNVILNQPLTGNLIDGLDPDNFFRCAMGARKGLVDKNRSTPISGYLERSLVLNLSPIEISEDDCKTDFGLVITIKNRQHAISLINKYYSQILPNSISKAGIAKSDGVWKLFTKENIEDSIGKTYVFRSPITCQTNQFKICKKCFGENEIKSPFVGIITGQSIAERMTQLSMRTFHTSGSSSLPTNDELVQFIQYNLKEIHNYDEFCIIEFNTNIPQNLLSLFKNINGCLDISFCKSKYESIYDQYKDSQNVLLYVNQYNVENQDVTYKIKEVNQLLLKMKANKNLQLNISDIYSQFIDIILELGMIYSSFIEIIFTNLFVYERVPIRYYLNENPFIIPDMKLNLKQQHTIISKLLGLVYEPNSVSLSSFSNNNYELIDDANTIFERLWKGEL